MMDEMEKMIKEKLLEELIQKMSDGAGDRMKPKGLGVEVQAADPEHLKEGLDKAKSLLGKASPDSFRDSDAGPDMDSPSSDSGEEDDEQRLLQLLDDDDEDQRR